MEYKGITKRELDRIISLRTRNPAIAVAEDLPLWETTVLSKAVIGVIQNSSITNATISACGVRGLSVATLDGKPAHLAVVDGKGNILEEGSQVANEVWNTIIKFYAAFLFEMGRIRVVNVPLGMRVV